MRLCAIVSLLFLSTVMYPSASFAAQLLIPETRFDPLPRIFTGIYQTAFKAGDKDTFRVNIQSPFSVPFFSADFSELGGPDATTTSAYWANMVYTIYVNGISYYPVYSFGLGPFTIGNVPDGLKTVSVRASDTAGNIATSTVQIIVDSTPPTLSLSDISFSTISPRKGDTMYLSGMFDGTGSPLKIFEIRETLWDALGNSVFRPGNGINYSRDILTSALASSTDGTFKRIPFILNDSPSNALAIAASMRISVTAYDASGHIVSSSLEVPISPADPCIATNTCASNVLFLPGIESSRLYRPDYAGGTDKLWEPNADSDVQDLYMNSDGSSIRYDVYTKERDILDELPDGENIYKSFIAKMDGLKTAGTIKDWEPIAYDWRLSLDDVLTYGNDVQGRIYYSGDLRATSTPYIIQELRRLASTSKTGKVTIVAHSNGGLLAKRLTQVLGPVETAKLIDKMIFVAVPQAGTPMSIPAGLHGYEQEHLQGLITSKSTARSFAVNAPMEYQLVPSANYFTRVDNPIITFDASLSDWISRYGATIHSQETLHTFLTDSFGRVDPQTGDIDQPIQMNDSLLTNAEGLHTNLDSWTPPSGVSLIQLAGWGVPKTVSGVTYKKGWVGVGPEPSFTIDGDGTVVTPSAMWTSVASGVQNFWIDLKEYNTLAERILGLRLKTDHASILEIPELLSFITDNVLMHNTDSLPKYISTSVPISDPYDTRLRYALHSPLTLNLYDDQGRHTGVSTTTSQIEEQIPGTYYAEFGDVKYLFSDASTAARVIMNGYAPGTFTFNVDQYSGDTLTASTTFKDIPTTASTKVTLNTQSDISALSPMQIDKDSDGTAEVSIAPQMNGIATFPKAPITVTADSEVITLGDPLPSLTVSMSGFVDNDSATSSDITGAPDCSVNVITVSVVGTYPITCTVGTLSSEKYDFKTFIPGVLTIRYRFDGYSPPISQRGKGANVFKGGSTIPVKFQLKTSSGMPVQASGAPVWIAPQKGSAMIAYPDETAYVDSGTSTGVYKWDSAAQQYVYNWSTKGLATGYWYKVFTKLDDGQTYSATVGLK